MSFIMFTVPFFRLIPATISNDQGNDLLMVAFSCFWVDDACVHLSISLPLVVVVPFISTLRHLESCVYKDTSAYKGPICLSRPALA